MVSTTGEHFAYFELNEALQPVQKDLPAAMALSVERIAEMAGTIGYELVCGVTRRVQFAVDQGSADISAAA